GMASRNVNDSYVSDCTIETDQLALIPDSYIDVTAEKIRIYKELDSTKDDRSLEDMERKLVDRFGKFPDEVRRLFDIVRIRHLAERLGFEKIIIKNGIMIAFFIHNPLSKYYKSRTFADILDAVNRNAAMFELKQSDEKLRIVARNIGSIEKAYAVLKKLQ
ncbi:MAG: transcription-repair coupling factor, partial [Bacteroidales bacterium]|nr:transcription-repair coupling factor [Bacteroidales bacterium]